MDYEKIKQEFSEFLGTIIDREHLGNEEMEYDIGLEFDFCGIVDKIEDFLKTLEYRQEKADFQADLKRKYDIPQESEAQENFCN